MKRNWLSAVLLGLGAFLIVAGVMAVTWAPGVAKKTPIDVDSYTYLDGSAQRLNTTTGELDSFPVYYVSHTQSDTKASSDDTALWVSTSCVVIDTGGDRVCVDGDDPNLVVASEDVFATDRTTAMAVESSKLPADAVPHEGLVNKFPFGAEKKTYPYWDGSAGIVTDAVYDRTEQLNGLEVYVYKTKIVDAPIKVGDLDATYDDAKEISVEPKTGGFVKQVIDQQRYLADGTKVLDLQIAYTDEQVADEVKTAGDNVSTLELITKTVPLIGFIGGGLSLLAGVALILLGRRRVQHVTG